MARMNDDSPYAERWTNTKLFREVRRYANLEHFSGSGVDVETILRPFPKDNGDIFREATRIYRHQLNHLLDILAKRLKVEP